METQIGTIFTKLESDDLNVLSTGLDEARTLIDQLAQQSVSASFTASDQNRFAVADKLFAMGPAVIPELEKRIEKQKHPEAKSHAALMLFKRGSMKGVPLLIRSLKDKVGPIGTIASALASAKIPGASEAIEQVLTREAVRWTRIYTGTLLEAVRNLELHSQTRHSNS